jgi:hypothetical protein
MPNDLARSIRAALLDVLAPLREAAADPTVLAAWLAELGYTAVVASDPAVLRIAGLAETIARAIEGLDDAALDRWDGVQAMLATARGLSDLVAQLRQFGQDPTRIDVAAGLADEIVARLLATHLRARHPVAFRVASTLGVVAAREHGTHDAPVIRDGTTVRFSRVLDRFDTGAAGRLLGGPGAELARLYLPNALATGGDAWLAAQRLFGPLAALADALGLAWRTSHQPVADAPAPTPDDGRDLDAPPRDFESIDLDLPVAPGDPVSPAFYATEHPAFSVTLARGEASELTLDLRASSSAHPGAIPGLLLAVHGALRGAIDLGAWRLTVSSQGEIPAVAITASGVALLPGGATVPGGAAHARLERVAPNGAAVGPVVAIGGPGGTRLEIGAVSVDAGLHYDPARTALSLSVGATQCAFVIAPSDGDGFLASVLPADGLRATFDLGLDWSSDRGLTLRGQAGLSGDVSIGRSVAGAALQTLHLALSADAAGAVRASVSVSVSAAIGPVRASVDGIGLAGTLGFPATGGNLAVADLALGLQAPTGVGLSIDAAGVVTGSGFLFLDAARGTYAGGMQLTLHDRLTVTAIGLIATRLPDGRPGYSLLVFITATNFQPVPLGLGFTLQGIGGLVAIHRTFDEGVLREGLKTDALATLLFPRDPATNAPAIVRALATAFPAQRGSYLLGLLARIGWGTPTLLQLDLALILELGARSRLLALGRLTALLPRPDNDLIRLKLDAIGVLDFDAGTVALDAVLVDSRLAGKFAVTGAGALRAGWGRAGRGTGFVLAVGGFNPRFAPPEGIGRLERVSIALSAGANPRLTCDAYFALTSNTIQFGAHAHLVASAIGFTVEGDVGFDVLIARAPFHFLAEFRASVQLRRGSHNLFKVAVTGSLEGPRPLRLRGKATFEILWCDFSVSFDATLVSGQKPPLPAAVDVKTELVRALTTSASWRPEPTASGAAALAHGVALRALPAAATTSVGSRVVLDPLGRLTVTQDVVPLSAGRDVEVFGGAPVAGDRRVAVAASRVDGGAVATTPVSDAFAPAQFFSLTDDEKLAGPSFETYQAGLTLGSTAIDYDRAQLVAASLAYDTITVDTPAALAAAAVVPPSATPYAMSADALATHTATGAAARAPARRVGRARFHRAGEPAIRLEDAEWAIVPRDGGARVAVAPTVRTWSEYRGALAELNRAGARFQLVPAREAAF